MTLNPNIKQKSGFNDKLQIWCVLYISVWAISPPLGYGTIYRVAAVLATAVWICIELMERPATFFHPTLPTLGTFIFVSYTALLGYWVEGSNDLFRNFQIYICLLFLVIHESYRKRDLRQLRIVFWVALMLFPIWLAKTLVAYRTTHNVSRLLTRSTGFEHQYSEQGIGGFALIYSILIGIPLLLFLTRRLSSLQLFCTKAWLRWSLKSLIVLTLVLGCMVILKAGFSIANLLMFGSILLTFALGEKKTFKTIRITIILVIFLVLIPLIFDPLTNYVETISRGTMYEKKVEDIKRSFLMRESVGTVDDRAERYQRSANLFLENPFFGTVTFDAVGKHSAILDRFARYGLIIGGIFAYLICGLPLRYVRLLSNRAFGMALAVAFVAIGFSFLNNVFSSFGFMLFIFYPVAVTYLLDETRWKSAPQNIIGATR